MILPLYDDVTAEYDTLCGYFDQLVDIGRHHDMIMRPARHLIKIDDEDDYFSFDKVVSGCWMLTKGLERETNKFALDASDRRWGNIRVLTTRFSHYSPGIGRFNSTKLQQRQ